MSTIETISPFPIEELPRVWLWLQEAGSSLLNDQGPQTMDEFVDAWLEREAITWGVYRDGDLGGWIAYEPISDVTGNAHCIFSKRFWGRKITQPALNRVSIDLWAVGVERIGMLVKEDNAAIISLIKHLGAEKEGEWIRTMDGRLITRKGEPIKLVQYGLLKSTWQAKFGVADSVADAPVSGDGAGVVLSAA